MRRLRSRWTVVALAPALFLASFAVVSSLADDEVASAPAAGGEEGPSTSPPTTGQAPAESPPPPAATTTSAAPESSGEAPPPEDDREPAAGDGGGAAPPPAGEVTVDYGRWADLFEISDTELVPELGSLTVTGQLSYLGGHECPVGNVVVRGTLYAEDGRRVGTGVWESFHTTGAGAELLQREPLFMEVIGAATESVASAALRVARVDCQ